MLVNFINNAILLEMFDNKVYNDFTDGLLLAVDSVLDDIPDYHNPEDALALRQGKVKLVFDNFNNNQTLLLKMIIN